MKIKTKKEMNLPQLIEWAKNNKIKNRMVLTKDSYCMGFDRHGYIYFNNTLTMPLDQVFTVEVEEEITEDTKIPKLIEIGIGDLLGYSAVNEDISISEITNKKSLALYVLNEDYSMKLIYKNGKLEVD